MADLYYYSMYPKDFDSDESVRVMSFAEKGLYLVLLNHAWLNDGLPNDAVKLARLAGASPDEFVSMWPGVEPCFPVAADGRRRNRRQESERSSALDKTAKAKASANARWGKNDASAHAIEHAVPMRTHSDRKAKAMQRASDSDSDSGFVSGSSHHQPSTEKQKAFKSQKIDDDLTDPKPKAANPREVELPELLKLVEPREALKEIFRRKTGEMPAIALMDALDKALAGSGTPWADYVAEIVENHAGGHWNNPPGFLRSLAKEFGSRTAKAGEVVTKREAEDAAYQCPLCKSRKRGEGATMRGGVMEPCICAAPEWIARQQARGVFAMAVASG